MSLLLLFLGYRHPAVTTPSSRTLKRSPSFRVVQRSSPPNPTNAETAT